MLVYPFAHTLPVLLLLHDVYERHINACKDVPSTTEKSQSQAEESPVGCSGPHRLSHQPQGDILAPLSAEDRRHMITNPPVLTTKSRLLPSREALTHVTSPWGSDTRSWQVAQGGPERRSNSACRQALQQVLRHAHFR